MTPGGSGNACRSASSPGDTGVTVCTAEMTRALIKDKNNNSIIMTLMLSETRDEMNSGSSPPDEQLGGHELMSK